MPLLYPDILTAVQERYPDAYNTGRWGCCVINNPLDGVNEPASQPFGESVEELQAAHPDGTRIETVNGSYWVWLTVE